MNARRFFHFGRARDVEAFRRYLKEHDIAIPCDQGLTAGDASPLAQPLEFYGFKIGNRFATQPMEGWDAASDGRPTDLTERRWRHFGRSGAKLIWGAKPLPSAPMAAPIPTSCSSAKVRVTVCRVCVRL